MITVFRIIFPGIFAIENNGDDGFRLIGTALANFFQMMDQVGNRVIGVPVGVLETNGIG